MISSDVVLGTLGDILTLFGEDGDNSLITGLAAVISQEGEKNGYYRALQGKIPSALPFLTSSTREFAFSALNKMFVVPGSCSNSNIINLPGFAPLKVLTSSNTAVDTQTIQFMVDAAGTNWPGQPATPVVYLSFILNSKTILLLSRL
jgi:hypothetical protein